MRSMQRSVIGVLGAALMFALPLSASAKDHGHNYQARGNFAASHSAASNAARFSNLNFSRSTASANPFRGTAANPFSQRYGANWARGRYAANYPTAANQTYYPSNGGYYPTNSYAGGYAPGYAGGYAPSYANYAPAYGSGYGVPYAGAAAPAYPGAYAYGGGAGCSSYRAERQTNNLDHLINEKAIVQQRMQQSYANGNYANSHRLHTQLEYVNQKLGGFNSNGCAAQNLSALSGGLPYNSYGGNGRYGYNGYNNGYAGSPMTSMVAPLLQGFIR
jgi:hypothetical protein